MYVTREGKVVGPLRPFARDYFDADNEPAVWYISGEVMVGNPQHEIISEFTDVDITNEEILG